METLIPDKRKMRCASFMQNCLCYVLQKSSYVALRGGGLFLGVVTHKNYRSQKTIDPVKLELHDAICLIDSSVFMLGHCVNF